MLFKGPKLGKSPVEYMVRKSLAKSVFMTTPSTEGPKAVKKLGGDMSADNNSSIVASLRQSTIISWSFVRSSGTEQFMCLANFSE